LPFGSPVVPQHLNHYSLYSHIFIKISQSLTSGSCQPHNLYQISCIKRIIFSPFLTLRAPCSYGNANKRIPIESHCPALMARFARRSSRHNHFAERNAFCKKIMPAFMYSRIRSHRDSYRYATPWSRLLLYFECFACPDLRPGRSSALF